MIESGTQMPGQRNESSGSNANREAFFERQRLEPKDYAGRALGLRGNLAWPGPYFRVR
jgi:hypothetical protein